MQADWWMSGRYRSPSRQGRSAYLFFMLRELTSVVLAAFLLFYLVQLARVSAGQVAYDAFLDSLRSPGMLFFHLVALAAAIYHAITWLQLTGVVMVVPFGGRPMPPSQLVLVGFIGWIISSAGVFAEEVL
jgi:fumarate reductase subunit C